MSEQTGLATSAIHYCEREGLLPKAPNEGRRRVYDPDILDQRAVIELVKDAGVTIAQAKRLLGPSDAAAPLASTAIQH